jgi:hypothetical protein
MKDKERQKRIAEYLAKETSEPALWWHLSFADDTGFLGVTIIQARGMITAVQLSHALGVNPGGEVQANTVDLCVPPPDAIHGKLVTDKKLIDKLCEQWVATHDAVVAKARN